MLQDANKYLFINNVDNFEKAHKTCSTSIWGAVPPLRCLYLKSPEGGGAEMLRRHLNFRLISDRFTLSFTNPSFQDLYGSHIMY